MEKKDGGKLHQLFGCRGCEQYTCQFNGKVAAGLTNDQGLSVVFGEPTYKCNTNSWLVREEVNYGRR